MALNPSKAGTVAIVGRPNVGKSTLLNQVIKYKLSPVSAKPQTTRHRILGILTGENFQIVFLDTPGIPFQLRDELNRRLLVRAREAMKEADLAIMMVEPRTPGDIEQHLIEEIRAIHKPALLVINKIDLVKKPEILPVIDEYNRMFKFLDIMPISALKSDGIDKLVSAIVKNLPEGMPLFPTDELTDRPESFLVSELIREQVFNIYGQEIPYSVAVEITEFKERSEEHQGKDFIQATLYVEKESQKAILIGKGGEMLKKVGTQARQEIEAVLDRPVYLELWVKVYPKWRRDKAFLERIGY